MSFPIWTLIAVVSAIIVNIVINLLANRVDKFFGENHRIKKMTGKQQFAFLLVMCLVFSIPTFYALLNDYPAVDFELFFNTAKLKVPEGDSRSAFAGDIVITVQYIECSYNLSRPVQMTPADFSIGSPGYDNVQVTEAAVGYSVIYQGNSTYEVRYLNALDKCLEAEFQVTKLVK